MLAARQHICFRQGMMIEAVIWDFGGVLTTSPFEAFTRYETERGLPADIIRRTNAANHLENAWAKLKRVKARFKTGCITNNLPANAIGSHSGRTLYVAEVMVLFDHVIESAKIGLRKPDPRIYRMMVETLQVDPKNCVYLDDLGVNLKPAREMGMTTIKVVNAAQAITELEAATGLALR